MIFLVKYPFNRFIWTSMPSSGWLPVKQSLLKVWLVVLWLRSSYEVSGPLGESSSLSLCFRVTSNPWAIYHLKIMRLANEKKRERSRNENVSGAYRYETNKSMYVRKVCACVCVRLKFRSWSVLNNKPLLNNTSCTHALSKNVIVITHPHSVPNIYDFLQWDSKEEILRKYIYF